MKVTDLARDIITTLGARIGRTLLLISAIGLSCGVLVAAFGLTVTAQQQIDSSLAAETLNDIVVTVRLTGEPSGPDPAIPVDAEQRALGVAEVESATVRLDVPPADAAVTRLGNTRDPVSVAVLGATAGIFERAGCELSEPVTWAFGSEPLSGVAVVGATAGEVLGIAPGSGYQVWIGGVPTDVVAVASDCELSDTIVIPYVDAIDHIGSAQTATLVLTTSPGAGAPVSKMIAQAVRPDAPQLLQASPVASLAQIRSGVDNQLGRLVAGIGVLMILMTTLMITNTMVVAVVARTAEIGLRRALGASSRSIAALFLAEGALCGTLGGLAGTGIGLLGVDLFSWINQWGVTLPVPLALAGPIFGTSIGLASALYPSWRAARINPAVAIRIE